MCGGVGKALRHAAHACSDDGASSNGGGAFIIERSVAVICGAGDIDRAALHKQVPVGIQTVTACIHVDRAAGDFNEDLGIFADDELVLPGPALFCRVAAAGGVDPVVAGGKLNVPPCDGNA